MVERYLQAVRYWLPVAERDDLVAELAEDIRSEVQEREREGGRPLGEEELRDLLQRHGHPLWVASRYVPQQWLIGPAVLPIYRQVLRWSLGGLAAIFVAAAVFVSVSAAPGRAGLTNPAAWVWNGVLWAFAYSGLLTLVFAWIERRHAAVKPTDRWDPAQAFELPQSPEHAQAAEAARIRVGAAGGLAGGAAFLAWWLGAWRFEPPAELLVRLTPIWRTLWWPILVLAVASMALAAVALVRPQPTRRRAALAFARDLLGAGVVAALLGAGALIEIVVPGAPAERVATLARTVNLSLVVTVAAFGLAYLAEALRDLRRARGSAPIRHWAVRLLAGD